MILCGGSGTRLWPLSRSLYPKQFLPLASNETLLQQTAKRLSAPELFAPPLILCSEEHRFIAAEQLRAAGVKPWRLVLEPHARNTAPAAAAAALMLVEDEADALMLVAPADHVIAGVDAFREGLLRGAEVAASGRLVTFGVQPTSPETGYGYMRRAGPIAAGAFAVARFLEKPDLETAKRCVEEENWYWNSGMFLFKARRYLEELARFNLAIVDACRKAVAFSAPDLDFLRLDGAAFEACPSDSIDYAVMEKTEAAAVIPVEIGWSDVGSWEVLWQMGSKDRSDNVMVGNALAVDSKGSYLRAEAGFVAALGVRNLVIVAAGDAVLVAARDRTEEVKTLVDQLLANDRSEAVCSPVVHRPWGSYESIKAGERFQVKHLTIKPGQKLSLQYHRHRAEHWVVVRGVAKIRRGSETFTLDADQSTYVGTGQIHSLENPGDQPLEIIEIQSGSYLGEDDIVRLEDRYGRT